MSWAGMLFDLTIPFWLSWRRSRLMAYTAVFVFHGLTGLLFNIGMFPWIMIGCTLVFFGWKTERGLPARLLRAGSPRSGSGVVVAVLLLFFAAQLSLAFQHWLIPGDVNWTEEGGRFAWRVMLVEKTGHATFFVQDAESGREWMVLPGDYLTQFQEQQMVFQPDMLLQFARFIAAQYERPVKVRVEAYVSWNGRSSRLLLDPTVDLLQVKRPPILERET
jgi:hypothetical protein